MLRSKTAEDDMSDFQTHRFGTRSRESCFGKWAANKTKDYLWFCKLLNQVQDDREEIT